MDDRLGNQNMVISISVELGCEMTWEKVKVNVEEQCECKLKKM